MNSCFITSRPDVAFLCGRVEEALTGFNGQLLCSHRALASSIPVSLCASPMSLMSDDRKPLTIDFFDL